MTLIEMLVSIAILAIIGGVVASAFSLGLKITRPGGPETRLLASHDLMSLEQSLGQDGARAACVKWPGGQLGNCNASRFGSVACPAADLCLGWPQVSDGSCHVVDYQLGDNVAAQRTEYKAGTAAALSSIPLAREVPVNIAVTSVDVVNSWVRGISMSITATGVNSPPTQTITLHPIATDPAGTSANILVGGSPC
jgi:prepilin-type N-terminal cleavage/methylation domain-containing protein